MKIIKKCPIPLIRFTCDCCKSIFEMHANESGVMWYSIDGTYTAYCPVCNQVCRDFENVTLEEFDESLKNL